MASFSSVVSLLLVPVLAAAPAWSQAHKPPGAAPDKRGTSADLAASGESVVRSSSEVPGIPASGNDSPAQLQLRLVDSDGSQVLSNTRTVRGLGVQVTDGNGAPVQGAAVVFRFPDGGSSASFTDGSHSAVAYSDASGNAHVGNFQWNPLPGAVPIRVTATKGDTHAGLLVEETLMAGAPSQASVSVRPVGVPATESEAAIQTVAAPAPAATPASVPDETVLSNPYRPSRLGISPVVSITNTGKGSDHDYVYHGGISKKKWILLGIVAGVGAGAALALMNGKSSSSAAAASSSGVSVGSPTISIGHP